METMRKAGRPRTFDPEQALHRALMVFWERGYEGASMTALQEATGLTAPQLYRAFDSKERLFKRAVRLYQEEYGFGIRPGIPLADEPAILARTIQLVQSLTDVPLSIDSSIVEALEARRHHPVLLAMQQEHWGTDLSRLETPRGDVGQVVGDKAAGTSRLGRPDHGVQPAPRSFQGSIVGRGEHRRVERWVSCLVARLGLRSRQGCL